MRPSSATSASGERVVDPDRIYQPHSQVVRNVLRHVSTMSRDTATGGRYGTRTHDLCRVNPGEGISKVLVRGSTWPLACGHVDIIQ